MRGRPDSSRQLRLGGAGVHAAGNLFARNPAEAGPSGRGEARGRRAQPEARPDRRRGSCAVNAVEVRGLVKRFGDKTVVDHVSMSIREGEIVGFLGPNGSGKT